jgi:hypothetical protein
MKKLILSVMFLCFSFAVALAQTAEAPNEDLKDKVIFETLEHNFGNVVAGSQARFEFVFKNTSDKTLEITAVRPSCGCTAPSYSKEPVASGKSGSIVAVYSAPSSPQAFSKSITVNTTHGTYRLIIKGNVVAADAEPTSPVKIN